MTVIWIDSGRLGPTVRDPHFLNVSLLLHGNGTNGSTTITDSSPTPKTITRSGIAAISTEQAKFGGSSILLSTSNLQGYIGANDIPAFGPGNWTIEMWVYPTFINASGCLLDFRTAVNQAAPLIWYQSNKLAYYVNGSNRIVGTNNAVLNQWNHIAVCKSNGITRQFVNGLQEGPSFTDTINYVLTAARPIFGAIYTLSSSTSVNCWMDEVRFTHGVGRYDANFTPPTAPFPDI
jgi:hypothetical protein